MLIRGSRKSFQRGPTLTTFNDYYISLMRGERIQILLKVSKGAKIRNRYNQVPHLTQDTYGKVTKSQLDTTNESQEVSPFPAGDHKAHKNRRAQRHSNHKTEKKHIKHPQKKYRLGTVILGKTFRCKSWQKICCHVFLQTVYAI